VPPWRDGGSWRERIRACLIELLSFLDDDPVSGRLVIVESLGAGRLVLERRGRVLAPLIAAVEEGRGEAKRAPEPPPLVAEGVASAVLSVLHGRLLEGDIRPLLGLVNSLTSMIVLPYLGPAASRAELERPSAPPSRPDSG
jgi:AcrR family transcriptional regulator